MRHYEVTLILDPSLEDKDTHRQGARLTRHPHSRHTCGWGCGYVGCNGFAWTYGHPA
jgi:hypothetical protein